MSIKELVAAIEDMNLPLEMMDKALQLIEQLLNARVLKRCAPKVVAAATLYVACKTSGIPLTVREIVKEFKLSRSERLRFTKVYRYLLKETGRLPLQVYIKNIVGELGLPASVERDAIKMYNEVEKSANLGGKNPLGYVAAAIYVAARKHGFKVTQSQVAKVAHVTEVTLRARYKELLSVLQLPKAVVRMRRKGGA